MPGNRALARRMGGERLEAAGRFRRFAPEIGQRARELVLKPDKAFSEIMKAWMQCRDYLPPKRDNNLSEQIFSKMLRVLGTSSFGSREIEAFSISIEGARHDEELSSNPGLFLSALIQNSRDDRFIIHTSHQLHPADSIGYRNSKNILVKGNAGDFLGSNMVRGSIEVQGNAGGAEGFRMKGGRIIIHGDCDYACGWEMLAGAIIIEGNAGMSAGMNMEGGEIFIRGGASTLAGKDMKGGRLEISGNAGRLLGDTMQDGIIIVGGDVEGEVGPGMSGGEIRLCGEKFELSSGIDGGSVFHNGMRIFPK